jgi:hypothetical protein
MPVVDPFAPVSDDMDGLDGRGADDEGVISGAHKIPKQKIIR